jgi:hypothetical protein
MYGGPEVLRCIVPQLLESLPELQAVVGGSASGVIGVRRNRHVHASTPTDVIRSTLAYMRTSTTNERMFASTVY